MTQSVATQKTKATVENKASTSDNQAFTSENQSITVEKDLPTEKWTEQTMDTSPLKGQCLPSTNQSEILIKTESKEMIGGGLSK